MFRRFNGPLVCVLAAVAAVMISTSLMAEEGATDSEWCETLDERIEWWNGARFGMFIHWGLYAIPAGEWDGERVGGIGEWIMHNGHIKPADYRPLAGQFNPTNFDAEEWVQLMKQAGCRYFVITTKHHDGFALFRSDVSDYDIANTPFGEGNDRDIMRELADAARKHGIRIGWYHSIMDWQHPDYFPRKEWDDRPTDDADFDRYQEYLHAQVEEILNNYGEIGIIWFDGEWEGTWTHDRGIELHEHCMRQKPKLLVNNRVDKGRRGMQGMNQGDHFRGDFGTPEQEIPAEGFGEGVHWESCMTMNDTWGYKSYDHNWKSATTLVQNLIDTASKGGNYLLNVGPTALGEIPEPSQQRLREMGDWLDVNGEAIYGTKASVLPKLPWGRATTKSIDDGNTVLYLHVFDWPEDGTLTVPGLTNEVIEVRALGKDRANAELQSNQGDLGVEIAVGDKPWSEHASVVCLVVDGTPTIDPKAVALAKRVEPDDQGVLELDAEVADIIGGASIEHRHGSPNIGFWTDAGTTIEYLAHIPKDGKYSVEIDYALASGDENEIALDFGEATSIDFEVKPTGGWNQFRKVQIGTVQLPAEETLAVRLRPTKLSNDGVMNLRKLTLTRIK